MPPLCKYVTLYGEGGIVDEIKVTVIEIKRLSWIIWSHEFLKVENLLFGYSDQRDTKREGFALLFLTEEGARRHEPRNESWREFKETDFPLESPENTQLGWHNDF